MSCTVIKKRVRIKYPVKLGYKDNSGKKTLSVTDSNDNTVVFGNTDEYDNSSYSFANKSLCLFFINELNTKKPIIYINSYELSTKEL